MPGLPLQTDAFVLVKRPPSDAFQGFNVFSPEHGALLIHQRISRKAATASVALDLFDEVSLRLESSNQGQTWFLQEARLVTRHADLGRSYETLRHASALAALVGRNNVHEDSRAQVAALLRSALAALARGARPDLIWFKSLFSFARDEGYPVKQEWLVSLTTEARALAEQFLYSPTPSHPSPSMDPDLPRLIRQLEDYLRDHTDILLE
ncbi:MAG: hypothetical protein JWM32_697 [Verrucomicrobia bacterium]|nr:hypothetical protein [Verrucomicrobiota bacterium]